jgi:hypothetical protein
MRHGYWEYLEGGGEDYRHREYSKPKGKGYFPGQIDDDNGNSTDVLKPFRLVEL